MPSFYKESFARTQVTQLFDKEKPKQLSVLIYAPLAVLAVLKSKMPVETRAMSESKSPAKAKACDKLRLRPRAFTDYRSQDLSLDLDEESFPGSDSESEEKPKAKANVKGKAKARVKSSQKKKLNSSKKPVSPDQEPAVTKEDIDAGSDDPVNGSKSGGATHSEADQDQELSWSSRCLV